MRVWVVDLWDDTSRASVIRVFRAQSAAQRFLERSMAARKRRGHEVYGGVANRPVL